MEWKTNGCGGSDWLCNVPHRSWFSPEDPSKEATEGIKMSSPDSGFGFLRMHPSCHDHPPDVSLPDDVKPFSNISGRFRKGFNIYIWGAQQWSVLECVEWYKPCVYASIVLYLKISSRGRGMPPPVPAPPPPPKCTSVYVCVHVCYACTYICSYVQYVCMYVCIMVVFMCTCRPPVMHVSTAYTVYALSEVFKFYMWYI